MFARLASALLLASAIFFAKSGSIPAGSFGDEVEGGWGVGVEEDEDGRGGRAAVAGGGASEGRPLAGGF